MKVADLQQHLADLARLLERAGGSKSVIADLAAIQNGLAPFREHPLPAFADFLGRAEAFSRGAVPVVPPKTPARAPRAATPKPPPLDIDALCREAKQIWDGASSPSVQPSQIDEFGSRLHALKKPDLVRVSEAIGMVGMRSKTMPVLVAAIRDRILARKSSALRAELIDRPESTRPTDGNRTGSLPVP